MIDLGALGFRRFCVLSVGFLCLSAALYLALSPDMTRRQYVSVFLVGKRGLDVPIDKPEHLVEYIQLKLLPGISREILGAQRDDVQVVFVNKPGSRFIRIITRTDQVDAGKVERMHQGLLQALQAYQDQRLRAIRERLIAALAVHREQLKAEEGALSKRRMAEIRASIYSATVQYENLAPSEVVEPFLGSSVDKLEARPVRLLLSLLLALLFFFLLVFLYALLSARVNAVSVESVR